MAETPPPDAMLVALCDAVAAAINAATVGGAPLLPAGVSASMIPAPVASLDNPSTALEVYVLPIDDPEERVGGVVFRGEYQVDVLMYRKFAGEPGLTDAFRAMMLIRQYIRDLMAKTPVSVTTGVRTTRAVLSSVNHGAHPAYSQARLWQERVFESAQSFDFAILPGGA